AFWQHARKQLGNMGLPQYDVESALRTLALRLDEDGSLIAPDRLLDQWPQVRDGLATLNVVQVEGNRIRFTHQSYFDYYLAELGLERLGQKKSSIADWLTPMDEQSLLRRSQLRQLLAVLRDDEPERFLLTVQDILTLPGVRFHLRHLTLEFLGHVSDPSSQEV